MFYRYLSNYSKKASSNRNDLKKMYEELVNSMDLVGFTDEVSCLTIDLKNTLPKTLELISKSPFLHGIS